MASITTRKRSISLHYTPPSVHLPSAPSDDLSGPSASSSRFGNLHGGLEQKRMGGTLELMDNDHVNLADEEGFESEDEEYKPRPPSIVSSLRSSAYGIHLDESSDKFSSTFATKVTIPRYHLVGPKSSSGYVSYEVHIFLQSSSLVLHRRYSSLLSLHRSLKSAFPHLHQSPHPCIPKFPSKNSFSKFRSGFVEERRKSLEWWLREVLLNPEVGGSNIVRSWILED